MTQILSGFALVGLASACGGGATPPAPPNCAPDAAGATTATSLVDAASCRGRLIGAALSTAHLADDSYASAARDFNFVTPESEMKWAYTEPTRDEFSFELGDRIVSFAEENGMKVKGHTLVWHNQLPSWVSALTDPSDLRAAMTNHITQEVEHYKGKVLAWDVVNEAWDPSDPTVLRDTIFSRLLGPSYIDDAFTAARAADPDAKLYYNDYGADGGGTKADSIYAMVADMKLRGIPIDGVGLQLHGSVASSLTGDDVALNIQRFAALGVEVVLSEMDLNLCYGGTLDDQAVKFHDVVAACLGQPNCPAATFWGITDKYSWLNYLDEGCAAGDTPRPLLWDDEYQKKPAYAGVLNALNGQ
jgi:endo-1,4-beta-xylanase